MKIYILVGIYTRNELGATGSISDCLIFKTKEEALKRLYQEISRDCERKETIEEVDIQEEQGKTIARHEWTTDWDSDLNSYEIREIDTDVVFNKTQE